MKLIDKMANASVADGHIQQAVAALEFLKRQGSLAPEERGVANMALEDLRQARVQTTVLTGSYRYRLAAVSAEKTPPAPEVSANPEVPLVHNYPIVETSDLP